MNPPKSTCFLPSHFPNLLLLYPIWNVCHHNQPSCLTWILIYCSSPLMYTVISFFKSFLFSVIYLQLIHFYPTSALSLGKRRTLPLCLEPCNLNKYYVSLKSPRCFINKSKNISGDLVLSTALDNILYPKENKIHVIHIYVYISSW